MTTRDGESIAGMYETAVGDANPVAMLLRRYLPGRGSVFGAAAFSTVVFRVSKLVPPYLLGATVDAFFTGEPGSLSVALIPQRWIPPTVRGQFALAMGLFVAVALWTRVAEGVQTVTWRWFQQSVVHDLRRDAFDAAQRLDVAFFESEQTGDVTSVLTNDVNQLETLLNDGIQRTVELTAFFLGLIAVMCWLHWQLTLVVLAFAPPTVGVLVIYKRVVEPKYGERQWAVGQLNAHVQNAVTGAETVKAFANEDRERAALTERSRTYWRIDWGAAKVTALLGGLRGLVANAAYVTVMVVGGWWALFGPPFGVGAPLSAGTFVTFYFYASMFVGQSNRVGQLVDTYADAAASARRVFGLLHYPSSVADADDATTLDAVDGRVTARGVTFAYPDADEPALRDVDFAVEPDDFVGLVGPTGAGKSTVLKLLLRFYDPDSGRITVDGVDLTRVTTESLRDAVGYVSQDPFLFDATVRENIAYGTDVDDAAVEAAAKRARAREFVTALPDGYDTEVGERGVKLSGGQRQRIAIARAIVRDPDILVLDEATSHVDNRTELLVQESLAAIAEHRTTFVVAHRLSTVRDADQILVFDEGQIVERGTHAELVERDGLYADLWCVHVGATGSPPDAAVESGPG
ncbi:ABC transporter [Halosimplex carlsbadense 2-9-1]|uniref:ABC transporter n=1 Tax=Halosimplex carlsbadense 2-9-1 TaxID=797114 RepID=M0CAA2_9EURY|nr:ABC transporter ATP-binding protein [Halosimplex carlsbadense]ELZ20226.1 ABC transporter [Halosimplex carlsbadense 2-9-1]